MNKKIVLPVISSEDISRYPDQTAHKLSLMGFQIETMWDTVYPVGSYYENSDPDFNPAEAWGGKWESVSGRWHRIA